MMHDFHYIYSTFRLVLSLDDAHGMSLSHSPRFIQFIVHSIASTHLIEPISVCDDEMCIE